MSDFEFLRIDDTTYATRLTKKFRARKPWAAPDAHMLTAFIPGVVRRVNVRPGQRVARGDLLLVLEAMKMQNPVEAAHDGIVGAIAVSDGEQVAKGQLLLTFESLSGAGAG